MQTERTHRTEHEGTAAKSESDSESLVYYDSLVVRILLRTVTAESALHFASIVQAWIQFSRDSNDLDKIQCLFSVK